MPWTICFPKDTKKFSTLKRICVDIPQLVRWPLRLPPLPDPLPFITLPDFGQEKVRHMQILATIDAVAEELPGELSRDIQRSVAAHMQSFGHDLGEDIELSRHTQTAKCD